MAAIVEDDDSPIDEHEYEYIQSVQSIVEQTGVILESMREALNRLFYFISSFVDLNLSSDARMLELYGRFALANYHILNLIQNEMITEIDLVRLNQHCKLMLSPSIVYSDADPLSHCNYYLANIYRGLFASPKYHNERRIVQVIVIDITKILFALNKLFKPDLQYSA